MWQKNFYLYFLVFFIFNIHQNLNAAEVSITLDDFDITDSFYFNAHERNKKILNTLDKHSIKAALFVAGKNIDNISGQKLLNEWDRHGHQISNHTYSHLSYSADNVTFKLFAEDILKSELLLKNQKKFEKFLRFPYLHEGNSKFKIKQMRNFLERQHYRNGAVTIDASDWYIDLRLKERLHKNLNTDLTPYRDYYLNHIWDRAQFYNNLSIQTMHREVKHTLLLHYNLLNALFLDDLLSMFENRG